jgi:hypothetical protein
MNNSRIKVKNRDAVMRSVRASIYEAAERSMTTRRERMREKLEMVTPVDTGEAAASWRVEGNQLVNDKEYIVNLNEGSSKQAPARFIEQALLSEAGVRPNGVVVTTT